MKKVYIFIAIIIIVLVGYFGFRQAKHEVYDIANGIAQTQVEQSTASLRAEIRELKKTNAQITDFADDISELTRIIGELKANSYEASSDAYVDQDPQKDFDFTKVYRKDANGTEVPVASVWYSPKAENPWTVSASKLDYFVNVTVDDEFKCTGELYFENSGFPETVGKRFPIDIKDLRSVRKPLTEKSFRFNPTLSLGVNLCREIYPSIGLNLFNYGLSKKDVDWRFITVDFGGTDENYYLTFSPVGYNLGNHIPLVTNFIFEPMVGVDDEFSTVYGGGVKILF